MLTQTKSGRDEQGSIIVAVSVIMILTLLSLAVLARSITAIASVRQNQDFSASLAQADAALSDALFRIDQFGSSNTTSFCVGNDPKCNPTSLPAAPSGAYKAVRVDGNDYTVTALGTVNNRLHAIQATVLRTSLFPFALFGNGNVTFNGNGSGTIQATLPNGTPDPNRLADVGSNNTITCNGGGSEGDQQVSYIHSTSGCPTPIAAAGTYLPKDPVAAASCPSPNTNVPPIPCVPPSAFPCPSGNTFSGVLAGTFSCTGTVTFSSSATISVNGSFQLYIIPSSGTADLAFAGTDINTGGDPTKFQVYLAGAGTVDMGNGAHAATITGTIWAPNANMTTNGCKMALTGALVIGTFTCNGGPNLSINFDSRIQALVGKNWTVTNYTEIPSSQFSLPGF
jgi:type II secretory pathway pseudopilin PulG